jgi:hypothetical protein
MREYSQAIKAYVNFDVPHDLLEASFPNIGRRQLGPITRPDIITIQ